MALAVGVLALICFDSGSKLNNLVLEITLRQPLSRKAGTRGQELTSRSRFTYSQTGHATRVKGPLTPTLSPQGRGEGGRITPRELHTYSEPVMRRASTGCAGPGYSGIGSVRRMGVPSQVASSVVWL